MAWESQCNKLFRQYEEILIVFNDSLQMFEDIINTLEQCIDFKEYDDFYYYVMQCFFIPFNKIRRVTKGDKKKCP